MLIFLRDGPSLQKLSQFETSNAHSAGATTRQIFNLTHGKGLSKTERKRLIQSLYVALETRFEDTTYGVIETTVAFKRRRTRFSANNFIYLLLFPNICLIFYKSAYYLQCRLHTFLLQALGMIGLAPSSINFKCTLTMLMT